MVVRFAAGAAHRVDRALRGVQPLDAGEFLLDHHRRRRVSPRCLAPLDDVLLEPVAVVA